MQELKVRLLRRDNIRGWSVEINNEFYGIVAQEEIAKFVMQIVEKLTQRLQ
jgi:hypothetical protein